MAIAFVILVESVVLVSVVLVVECINWIKKIKISRYGDLLPKSVISVEVPDWHIDLLLVPVYKFPMVRFSETKCCVTLRGRF